MSSSTHYITPKSPAQTLTVSITGSQLKKTTVHPVIFALAQSAWMSVYPSILFHFFSFISLAKRDKKSRKPSQKDSPYFEPGMGHRNSRKSKDIKAQCILCQSDNTTDGMSATMSTMPHLKDLIRYKETAKADKGEGPVVDFLIVDLRQNKSGGLLPKSHQVEFNKPMEETVNFLINDFIELQSQIHFVFMTSNFNSWMFKEALEARNLKNKKGPRGSLKSDRTGIKGSS